LRRSKIGWPSEVGLRRGLGERRFYGYLTSGRTGYFAARFWQNVFNSVFVSILLSSPPEKREQGGGEAFCYLLVLEETMIRPSGLDHEARTARREVRMAIALSRLDCMVLMNMVAPTWWLKCLLLC
jgi:hypothetical protein